MGATDIGIDLGTSNIVMAMGKKGVVLSEPSVIAYNTKTEKVIAVGQDAYNMIGKNPEYIEIVRPLSCGVISDDEMTQCLIKEFIYKVTGKQLVKPRIVICVPSFITDVEKRAVVEAAMGAGSRKAYLIDEPIAAMIGAGVDIAKAKGHMVVDIGGGTTDVAIVSMNGLVTSKSVKTAGNRIDEAIIRYIQSKYKLLIGQQTAEKIKIEHTNLYTPTGDKKIVVSGRNLLRGLPEKIYISENELFTAMEAEIFDIMEVIREVLEETPPELVGDIYENGVLLTGGGALLGGFKELIRRTLGVKAVVADDAINCVAKGTVIAFRKINNLLEGMENIAVYQYHY
ncbi:MAG: rod shape-determining protein [Oscillospiraceae bacterium]|nr:rod shape-determining protein [Oscillospiraceae bacterium]MDD6086139.1 rod shape-determining protein [Oscillospiraceae bacterium]MDY3257299.1 rod shape-determining protein [Ruminococcus callidus]